MHTVHKYISLSLLYRTQDDGQMDDGDDTIMKLGEDSTVNLKVSKNILNNNYYEIMNNYYVVIS